MENLLETFMDTTWNCTRCNRLGRPLLTDYSILNENRRDIATTNLNYAYSDVIRVQIVVHSNEFICHHYSEQHHGDRKFEILI
jgi:hypothetical protein